MLSAVRQYYQSKSDKTDDIFEPVQKFENIVEKKSIIHLFQRKVIDYFK